MLFDLAVKTLWRRKLRSLLTIFGVASAIQLYLMSNNIMGTYDLDIQRQVNAFAGKIYVQQTLQNVGAGGDFPSMDSSIAADSAEAMLAVDGVDRAASSVVLFVPLASSARPNMPPIYFAVGITPGHESAFLGNSSLKAGSAALNDPHSVILGSKAAEHYRPEGSERSASVGDRVTIHEVEFVVAGVLEPSSTIYNGTVIMPLATAQDLFNRPSTVSAVILTASRLDNLAGLKKQVQEKFPNLQVFNQGDLAQNANQILAMQRLMFEMIKNSVILATIMMVMIVVVVAVMEQRKEIGTLRAVGAGRGRILLFVTAQAVVLSLAGGIVALPVSTLVNTFFNFGLAFTPVEIVAQWITIVGGCVLLGLVAAFLPAWQAVRVNPLEALQSE
jgi:ABC-type antimicrobial peptide transport system permease subunit